MVSDPQPEQPNIETITPIATAVPETPPKRLENRKIIIMAAALLVLLIIIGGLVLWALNSNPKSQESTNVDSQQTTTSTSGNLDVTNPASIALHTRDTERKTDMRAVSNQLEMYYAKFGGFPALSDINNVAWRTSNSFSTGANNSYFADPLTPTTTLLLGTLPTGSSGGYTYIAQPTGCVSPSDANGQENKAANYCTSFKLIALLENKYAEDKDPSSTNTQTFYIRTDSFN